MPSVRAGLPVWRPPARVLGKQAAMACVIERLWNAMRESSSTMGIISHRRCQMKPRLTVGYTFRRDVVRLSYARYPDNDMPLKVPTLYVRAVHHLVQPSV